MSGTPGERGDAWQNPRMARRALDRPDASAPDARRFEALYYADLLHVVNPLGDVGILTLWTPVRTVERKLAAEAPDVLDPERSRVAVVANLYGDGMYAMLCNLLFNPQIRHLIALGQDLGLGAADQIEAFLRHGLEDDTLLGQPVKRVPGTERIFPVAPAFDAARLREQLTFHGLGKLTSPALGERLRTLLDELPRAAAAERERIRVTIPTAVAEDHEYSPSEVAAHQVVRRGPLDCWEELMVRVARFGRPVELENGPRLELLNARAVITRPEEDPPEALAAFGFELDRFHAYQRRMLQAELPDEVAYTYGNRLRGYFEQGGGSQDTLASAIAALRANPRTRRAYVSLWDTRYDLRADPHDGDGAKPCLTTLFFRLSEDRLTMTATYRAHNLLTAWLENVYGLMAVQRHVADGAGLNAGPITVLSHSLGIDPRSPRYALARRMAEQWQRDDDLDRGTGKWSLREDPNGYFIVSADAERGLIVADHRYGGVLVKRYEAERASTIEQQVSADMAVSLVSHALWLGRELTRNEQRLRSAGGRT